MEEKTKIWWGNNWFKLVAIILLLVALGDKPYDYYQILRFAIMVFGIYAAYVAYNSGMKVWIWIFGVIAVLFNPIFPISFQKDTWQIIDFLTAIIFFISMFIKGYKKF